MCYWRQNELFEMQLFYVVKKRITLIKSAFVYFDQTQLINMFTLPEQDGKFKNVTFYIECFM